MSDQSGKRCSTGTPSLSISSNSMNMVGIGTTGGQGATGLQGQTGGQPSGLSNRCPNFIIDLNSIPSEKLVYVKSVEHVWYEIYQLFKCNELCKSEISDNSLKDNILECYLLHYRCLLEFIGIYKKTDPDILQASDFGYEGKKPYFDKQIRNRLNEEICHPNSIRRIDKFGLNKEWPIDSMLSSLKSFFKGFLKFIHNEYQNYINFDILNSWRDLEHYVKFREGTSRKN